MGFFANLEHVVQSISRRLDHPPPKAKLLPGEEKPLPVRVVKAAEPFTLSQAWPLLAPTLKPLGGFALAMVLLMFMLIRREDLRDRVIRLGGHGRLSLTTKALGEVGDKISRFLLLQMLINGSFGTLMGAGLYFIGVPYFALWGLLAAVLRYIPYIGPWVAISLPLGLSLLVFDSWSPPLLIGGLFLLLELIFNMIMEPWLYGRGIGVSETSTLLMIAFWTWLWGPIGLVMATPLTVCLVVLGKYAPDLKFLDILLGDQPALEPPVGFYQRLVAKDVDEAQALAADYCKEHGLEQTYDALLLPALTYARRDWDRDNLSEEERQIMLDATGEIVEQLATLSRLDKRLAEAGIAAISRNPALPAQRVPIVLCPARDESDQIALLMLKELLDPDYCDAIVADASLLTSEVAALIEEKNPALLCIAALPPGGVAHARLLCLRLRARFPDLKILIGRWGFIEDADGTREQFLAAGCDRFSTNLLETRNEVMAQVRLLIQTVPETLEGNAAGARDDGCFATRETEDM